MQQLALIPSSSQHGGVLARGKRKARRPLARKRPLHLVLKAKGNLLRHRAVFEQELARQSQRFGLRVYGQALAFDHAHLLLKIPGRKEFVAFLRALTGRLAQNIQTGLWALPPFTRVASWGKEFQRLRLYLKMNREEAAGLRPLRKKKKAPGS